MIKKALVFSLAVIMSMMICVSPVFAQEGIDDTDSQTTETKKHSKEKREKKNDVAEPENAIGKDVAKEKALSDASLTSDQIKKIRSRVTTLEDGTVIYKVSFVYDSQKYSYQIDALTGSIINKSSEEYTKNTSKDSSRKQRPSDKQKNKQTQDNSLQPTV